MPRPRILIIEDDPDGAQSVCDAVEDAGFETTLARDGREGLEKLAEVSPDLVLTDLVMPGLDGMAVLRRVRAEAPHTPVILMTAHGSVPSSVQALKEGAHDYLIKPLDLDELQAKVRGALDNAALKRRVADLSAAVNSKFAAREVVVESAAMRAAWRQVEALADTMATVLVTGESGTGKELVARALHVDSCRASGPFVAINCAAFTETLLESELFGHEKGAFTGAVARYAGAFERADGGTLFLDEIGDAPPSVQVKLLRALEELEIRRVGGAAAFRVKTRLVSATHRDLAARVREGVFREDLFYRLNVVTIHLPPLRERRADIRPLADRFIARACASHGRKLAGAHPSFYARLEAFDWPGNIRQLRNAVETAVLLAADGTLRADSLRLPDNHAPGAEIPGDSPGEATGDPGDRVQFPDGMTLEGIERRVLEQTLEETGGNRTLTADKLGLSRRTIQRKIKEHGLPY
ncbi:MAG: sigma-54 dependent transcriptional regulator [Kiritimatiellaeota bacterium]|nr:sigma-54 dependent transcriptional regulator [Kiritimatiellota bacterium]